jgi:hypothetical protein
MILRLLVIISFFILTTSFAFAGGKISAQNVVERFQMYCFETEANFVRIERVVKAMKLKRFPDDIAKAVAAPNSKKTKLYLVQNIDNNRYISLGFAQPNTCSINVQGIDFLAIKNLMIKQYKLTHFDTDDIGLQINTMYILGGGLANNKNAREFGAIFLVYGKPSMGYLGGTIGYLPPDTAKAYFDK